MRKTHTHGFTLIEVLISMVILAIGLFGLAGLQTNSLKANNSAYQRSVATFLAYDLIDRMRTNREQALAGAYDFNLNTTIDPPGLCASDNPNATIVTCNPQALAIFDRYEWLNRVSNTLPQGTAEVSVANAGDTRIVELHIQWLDFNPDGTTETQNFYYSTGL